MRIASNKPSEMSFYSRNEWFSNATQPTYRPFIINEPTEKNLNGVTNNNWGIETPSPGYQATRGPNYESLVDFSFDEVYDCGPGRKFTQTSSNKSGADLGELFQIYVSEFFSVKIMKCDQTKL